jgi:hypothetical protein
MGGDTLDAFAPLSHYTNRVHNDHMESTWTKVSRTFFNLDGTIKGMTEVKELDYIPEAAGLISAKVKDPLARRE